MHWSDPFFYELSSRSHLPLQSVLGAAAPGMLVTEDKTRCGQCPTAENADCMHPWEIIPTG